MPEHLHGYPPCATPAGQPCAPSDLAYEECKSHGALRACEPSVVDGIPTGSYRCAHDEKAAAAGRVAKKKPAKKAMKTKKAKAAPARKAARKSAGKKGAKAKKAGGSKKAKKAKRAKPAKKAKKASKAKTKKARRR